MSKSIWKIFSTMVDGMVRSLEAISELIQENESKKEREGVSFKL